VPTIDQRKNRSRQQQNREQDVPGGVQTRSMDIGIDASGPTPNELNAEEQTRIEERDKRESRRSSVAANQRDDDDQSDRNQSSVSEETPETGPSVSEKAIADEQPTRHPK